MRNTFRGWWVGLMGIVACGSPSGMTARPSAPATTTSTGSVVSAAPACPSTPSVVPAFAAAPPAYAFADPDRRRKLLTAIPAIEAMMKETIAAKKITGIAVGIVIDGDLAYSKGFGVTDIESKKTPDADTVYRIGSITKSFTALTTLALRDEGLIALDDPLTKYVPEAAALVYPTRDARPITIRHLLNHTAGLPRQNEVVALGASEGAFLQSLAKITLETTPGERSSYSNLGYALLGIAMGRAAHKPYRELVASHILEPLGMTSTAWSADQVRERLATPYVLDLKGKPKRVEHPPELVAEESAGGLYSSVRDLARYLSAQIAAYPARNDVESAFLRRSSLREAHAPSTANELHVDMASAPQKGDSLVFAAMETDGYGWHQEQTCEFDDTIWHSGGLAGFRSDIRFLRERGVGIITLTNVEVETMSIAHDILTELRHTGALLKRKTTPPSQLEAAMTKLLALYNEWSDAGYQALRLPGRAPASMEKDELAAYKALHGACKSFSNIDTKGAQSATFKLDCEHGPFEMQIAVADTGLLTGFNGISRDQPLPKELRPVAEAVAGLIRRWDPVIYAKYLGKSAKTLMATAHEFEGIRAAHEACKIKSSTLEGVDRTIELACERGGDLLLNVEVDPQDANRVTSYAIRNPDRGTCPLR